MSNDVRVRFAPSPTGYLHVGGARTALFNYLFALHTGGKFILRIEDTDRTRFEEGALGEIFDSLKWLGLDWSEGPTQGGDYGPYVQSERLDIYKKHSDELIEKGYAYRCFCDSERLAEVRKEREKSKMKTSYDRHCRDLTDAEIKEKLEAGEKFVVRLKIPDNKTIKFNDLIRGEISYESDILDDLVLLKRDGFPTYHLANVVDDHHMRISHVLRGDEWITSTPRHVLLYQAFGWDLPVFAHLPVILSPTGGKLSKRKGAASVMDYKRAGYLPDTLFNFLALLGWAPGDDREKMTREEIIRLFDLEKISPKGAVLDEKKLDWMNGLYLQEIDSKDLFTDVVDGWKSNGLLKDDIDDSYLISVIDLMKVRSKRITDIIENSKYFFVAPTEYDQKGVRKFFKPDSVTVLTDLLEKLELLDNFDVTNIENVYKDYAEKTELSGGKLIHPTRLAVSGVTFGAGLFELMELLGKEAVIERMRTAINWIKQNS